MGCIWVQINFDDVAADNLISIAESVAGTLRGQSGGREDAVSGGLDDFKCSLALVFTVMCLTEHVSRCQLAGVLEDLALDVREAKLKAAAERQRLDDLKEEEKKKRLCSQILGSKHLVFR